MINLIFNIIIFNLFYNINCQSLCPDVFWWANDNNKQIYGALKIDNFDPSKQNVLTVRCTGLGNPQLVLFHDKDDSTNDLINRQPIYFALKLQSQNELPDIVDIVSNDIKICQNSKYIKYAPAGMKIMNFKMGPITWSVSDNAYHYSEDLNFTPFAQGPPSKYNSNSQSINLNAKERKTDNSKIESLNIRLDDDEKTLTPCGVPKTVIKLVSSGKPYSQESLPWLTILRDAQNNDFICAGSLISQKSVVTAAHCFDDNNNNRDYIVSFGEQDLGKQNAKAIVSKPVDNILIHPGYSRGSIRSFVDVAIVILRGAVEYSSRIIPICLWNSATDFNSINNKKGVVAGWGSNKQLSNRSTQAVAKVADKVDCLQSNPAFAKIISDTTFCAGFPGKTGSCNGDAGSGLVFELNKKWYLGGIVSRSLSHMTLTNSFTCNLDEFLVYTDVSKFLDWIKKFIND